MGVSWYVEAGGEVVIEVAVGVAVGAGTGVLVAGSVGCAAGAQPIKTRLAITPPNIILIAKNVLLIIRVFIIFLLEIDVITE
jgi:hypothetical protein